jgi:PAS domain S-box-containing protein
VTLCTGMSQTERICAEVSGKDPHTILQVDISINHILGYSRQELLGNDLCSFYGPETDSTIIDQLFSSSKSGQDTDQRLLVLYDKQNRRRRVIMSVACRQKNPTIDSWCINITHVPNIAVPIGRDDVDRLCSSFAAAIVSCEWPYFAQRISAEFTRLFGYDELDILGQNVSHRIKPEHAMSASWRALVRAAALGHTARDIVEARSKGGRVFLVDVTSSPIAFANGSFGILMLFIEDAFAGPDSVELLTQQRGGRSRSGLGDFLPVQEFIRPSAAPPPARDLVVDEAYVRRVRRRHLAAARRAATAPSIPPPSIPPMAPMEEEGRSRASAEEP